MINGAHAILYSNDAISDQGWGLLTAITLPGGVELGRSW